MNAVENLFFNVSFFVHQCFHYFKNSVSPMVKSFKIFSTDISNDVWIKYNERKFMEWNNRIFWKNSFDRVFLFCWKFWFFYWFVISNFIHVWFIYLIKKQNQFWSLLIFNFATICKCCYKLTMALPALKGRFARDTWTCSFVYVARLLCQWCDFSFIDRWAWHESLVALICGNIQNCKQFFPWKLMMQIFNFRN